ncbi:hypothetical protein D3C72_387320 [compost metagenome]
MVVLYFLVGAPIVGLWAALHYVATEKAGRQLWPWQALDLYRQHWINEIAPRLAARRVK